MKLDLKIFLIILPFLVGCQPMHLSSTAPSTEKGQVNLYLSTTDFPPSDITFTLTKIEVAREDKEWITLFEGKREINSINLAGRQIFLSENHLPTGRFEMMKTTFTEASLFLGGKKFTLAVPPPGEDLILPVEFQIFRKESVSLFLNWDVKNSIKAKYLFQPIFLLKPQKMEIRRLLLYVTNTGSNNITVINRQNDQVVASIGVDNGPMGIVTSPSGDRIYVANSDSNTISIIDTSHNRVIDTISLNFGISPRELAISPDGRRLYVSNFHSNNVSIIDTVGKNMLGSLDVGNNPMGIGTNARGDKVYVVNSASNNLSVIDPFLEKVIYTVGVGSNPTDLIVARDKIYVVNAGAGTIYQINPRSFMVKKEITAGFEPHKLVGGLMDWIYVANRNSNDISFIPPSMNMATQRIAVKNLPQEMVVDRERRKLYVANGGSDTISIIDLVREKLIGSIPVGKNPYGLALIE